MKNKSPHLEARLAGLAAFLPEFQREVVDIGHWKGGDYAEPGVMIMPHFCFSETALALEQAMYDFGWVDTHIDWPTWCRTEEAQAFERDPSTVARATADQLTALITTIVRQDRYVEGSLAGHFESGLVVAILERAAALLAELRAAKKADATSAAAGGKTP